jgi:hypothetical protein
MVKFQAISDSLYEEAEKIAPENGKPRRYPYKIIDSHKANAEAFELARRLEIPVLTTEFSSEEYCWDGKVLRTHNRSASDIIHDIAHHQCSAPSRRHLPEWGLGTSPDMTKHHQRAVDEILASDEESCASLLGILWERKFRMPWVYTFDLHSWFTPGDSPPLVVKDLYNWGLITENLDPKYVLRA